MTGTVTRIFLTKGYGFVMGSDGESYFMHARDCRAGERWERMQEGMTVEFEPSNSGSKSNGLRAKNFAVRERMP